MYYPTAPFVRANHLLLDQCAWNSCYGEFGLVVDEFHEMCFILFLNAVAYAVLALYLNQVVPQTYGVAKHPLFFLESFIKAVSPALHSQMFEDQSHLETFTESNELKDEDLDVKDERDYVHQLKRENYSRYPLVAKNLRKVYPGSNNRPPKVANQNISIRVESGELFGLLGPNGAGKTTLISQLIGMFPPTRGNAWIGGYDIRNNLEIVQLQIGVCPQFDILWENLTVEEHLLFYARIKGIPP